jgi:hypothetical protein
VSALLTVRSFFRGPAGRLSGCSLAGHAVTTLEKSLKSPRLASIRAALCLSALGLVALVTGCGGGGSSSDAKDTVKDAFSHSIKSANVSLQFSAKIDGVAQLQQPTQLKLNGPFQSNGKSKLPSLNWQASFSGGGQSVSGALISTGDNAFVSFQGTNYEVGKQQIAQINQRLGTQTQGKSLKDFGIDPVNWITDAQDKGDENVNGTDTKHVQAGLDIEKMLNDLNKTIDQAGGAVGQAPARKLTPQQISQVKDIVKNPKFDVYVGKDDDTLRRLNVSIDFSIPGAQRSQFGGAEGGNITFSLDLSKVGEPQTITAPPNPKPISELQGSLGGLGSGGSGGSSGGGGSGSSGKTPSAAQFQKYSQCLEKANPSDTAAIQKCAQLLK